MKVAGTKALGGVFVRSLFGFFGAGLILALSPILLLLSGSIAELGEHTNVEFGFSLLTLVGTSVCLAGLVSNVYRLLEAPFPASSLLIRLPAQPGATPGGSPQARGRVLPVVVPSLVLPTLISGLGGWVGTRAHAPR